MSSSSQKGFIINLNYSIDIITPTFEAIIWVPKNFTKNFHHNNKILENNNVHKNLINSLGDKGESELASVFALAQTCLRLTLWNSVVDINSLKVFYPI